MKRPQGWGWAVAASTEGDLDRPHLCQAFQRGGSGAGEDSFGPKVKCTRIRPNERRDRVNFAKEDPDMPSPPSLTHSHYGRNS